MVSNTHHEVARAFVKREKKKLSGSAMYFDGDTIYSWGGHFPIAHWAGERVIFFNVDGYENSVSTQKHTGIVRNAIGNQGKACAVEVDLETMKKICNGWALVVKKEHTPTTIEEAVCALKVQLKRVASPQRTGWFIRKLKEQLKLFQFFEEL